MRNVRLALVVALYFFVLGAVGCSYYRPQGMWEITTTEVDIESNNFIVRKLGAQGSAVRTYLFGIPLGSSAAGIALSPGDVQATAMERLQAHWDGVGSCVFHNINQEWTSYGVPGILIFHQNTVTADIYEFTREYVNYATRGERGM